MIALPWIVCSSTTGCYESKVTDNYFQDRLHLHHRPIAIKARSSRTAGLFSRSSASPTDCYQSKINCFSSTGRLLLEQGHQEQQDHSQGRLHQHHRSIAIEARPSASAASADCYRSKVIKNSITGRLLSKQGQLLSAAPADCYRSKVIKNSRTILKVVCVCIIDRLLSKQGRLHQHHRPIAIEARPSAPAAPADCYRSKVIDNHLQGRLPPLHRPIVIIARLLGIAELFSRSSAPSTECC